MNRFHRELHNRNESEMGSLYEDVCENLGRDEPPNFFVSMSRRPDIAAAVWGITKLLLTKGMLPPSVSQLMMIAISEQADCRYCAVAHQRALESLGIKPETVQSCLTDPANSPLPELHRQLVVFATKAARDPNSVTDQDVAQLRALGLEEKELIEASIVVALCKLVNTWADATGIPVDALPKAA